MKTWFAILSFLPLLSFGQVPAVESSSASGYTYAALGISILALLACIYLFTVIQKLKAGINGTSIAAPAQPSPAEVKEVGITTNISEYVKQHTDKLKDWASPQFTGLNERLTALENPPRTKEWTNAEIAKVTPETPAAALSAIGPDVKDPEWKDIGKPAAAMQQPVPDKPAAKAQAVPDPVKKGALPKAPVPASGTKAAPAAPANTSTRTEKILPVQQPVKSQEQPVKPAVPVAKPAEVTPVFPEKQLFFAKFPDQDNAFSEMELQKEQRGEGIYEFKLGDHEGSFEITMNLDAQKYALSEAKFYLPGACVLLNEPVKDSLILTRKPGTVIKSGDKWIIQEKAEIEFK